ncbi:hypothetical protein PsorP6_006573 [Peronosclerospora sorghi]|uniref:Uncharacterized protein n=1 Tax=Peronosclerospora sorghi TaxID=230839 RepID=A0ACC0W1H1_9STRA|nr:hypothetical protein PsorP6_006573 [Peronosclerospora sorghi]
MWKRSNKALVNDDAQAPLFTSDRASAIAFRAWINVLSASEPTRCAMRTSFVLLDRRSAEYSLILFLDFQKAIKSDAVKASPIARSSRMMLTGKLGGQDDVA